MTQAIPPALALLLPFIVTPLVGWLRSDQLASWLNTIIVLVVVFAAAACWALFVHSLTGNVTDDIVLLAGYIAALMAGPLKPLYDFATLKLPSPLAMFAKWHAETEAIINAPYPRVALRAHAGIEEDIEGIEESPVQRKITLPMKPLPEHSEASPGEDGSAS
jgi:hypothetical protein